MNGCSFIEKAGVAIPGEKQRPVEIDELGALRKQIYLDFSAAGLAVSQVQIEPGHDPDTASACITVNCPPELRGELMSQARRLSANPAVRRVHFGAQAAMA